MTYRQIAAVACVSLGLGCTSASPSFDRLISFVDPKSCEPDKTFDALLNSLVSFEPSGVSYTPALKTPQIPPEFSGMIGTPHLKTNGNEYRATLPLHGVWHNLPLRSVAVVGWVESEQGFELLFDADRAQVLATANRLGFGLAPSGSEYREAAVMGLNIGVSEHGDGAAIYCMPG